MSQSGPLSEWPVLPTPACGPTTWTSNPHTGQTEEVVLTMARTQASSKPENRTKLRLCPPMTLNILAPRHSSGNHQGWIGHLARLAPLTPPGTVLLCLRRCGGEAESAASQVPGNPRSAGSVKVSLGWTRVADPNSRKCARANAVTLLAFALCLFTIFFVVGSTSHIHSNGQEDAACRLCQAAHVGISAPMVAQVLPVPLVERAELFAPVQSVQFERFLSSASPRAPPFA